MQLEADFVLSDPFRPGALATPERRLLLAVLEEAIGTYQRCVAMGDRVSSGIRAGVEDWLASEEDVPLFSFVGICDVLGIESAYVRTGLALWTARHRKAAYDAKERYHSPFRRVNGTRHRALANEHASGRAAPEASALGRDPQMGQLPSFDESLGGMSRRTTFSRGSA